MTLPRLPLTSILPAPRKVKDKNTKEHLGKLNTFLDDYMRKTGKKVNQIVYELDIGAVMKADYDAHTILYASADDTPTTLSVAASRVIGRKSSGNISAMTAAETRTVLGLATGDSVVFGDVTVSDVLFTLGSGYHMTLTGQGGASSTLTIDVNDSNRTVTILGNPTLNDWFNQSVKSTASPNFVRPVVTGLFFSLTQNYIFGERANNLYVQGQTANTESAFEVFTRTGDGDDICFLNLWGYGTPDSATDRHLLNLGYPGSEATYYVINTQANIQDVPALRIYTGANTTQLVLATDNDISMSGALVVTGSVTGATGSVFGNLTLADGSITDSGGSITFDNENLSTTGTADFGATTVDSLTLDLTQDYLFTERGTALAIQSRTDDQPAQYEFYTKKGDSGDDIFLILYAHGRPDDLTGQKSLGFGFDQSESYWALFGSSDYPLNMSASASLSQFVLGTDGNNTMSGDLAVTGSVTGGSFITGGNIGVAADTDLLQLADGVLTVNGTIPGLTLTDDLVMGGNIIQEVELYVKTYLYHYGDLDTGIYFGTDNFYFLAGGLKFLKCFESAVPGFDELIINEDQADINLKVMAVGQTHALFVQGSDGKVGIRDAAPASILDVTGDINTTEQYKVDDVQVVTNQQAHIADSSTQDLTGTDSVHQANLESDLANIVAAVNAALSALETHGLLAGS